MNRLYSLASLFLTLLGSVLPARGITLGECVAKARENYPAIKQYAILDHLREADLSEINSSWLPRVGISVQATIQNAVPAYPDILSDLLDKMGQSVEGLGRFQYKAGLDLSQTIWDGGASAAHRKGVKARNDVDRANLEVELYRLREQVENHYFAILMIERQIEQARSTLDVLQATESRVSSMLTNGVAMRSDLDMVKASILELNQRIAEAGGQASAQRIALSLLVGEDVKEATLELPEASPNEVTIAGRPEASPNEVTIAGRPELQLFASRKEGIASSEEADRVSLMPKIGAFAQGWYGYPGLNYFESMMSRDPSFNLLAGVKISWQLDAFYNRSTKRQRNALNRQQIENNRETFLFNTNLQASSQREAIRAMHEVIGDDAELISLRVSVRKAAESQLANGVIDMTALLNKINDENQARIAGELHKIQLLKEIHHLNYILGK